MKRGAEAPRILVASGFDPSGRAGLLADVATIRSLDADPIAIATALTAQGTGTFTVDPVSATTLSLQLRALLELGRIDAVKVGMIPSRAVLRTLWRELVALGANVPIVVDPVVRTSKGQRLSSLHRRDYLGLAGPNVVLTPNLAEAAWLTDSEVEPTTAAQAQELGLTLAAFGFGAVVVKGGHLEGVKVDVVCEDPKKVTLLEGSDLPRKPGHRGTGCRFASALAVGLARSSTADVASRGAKRLVEKFLRGPILGAT